MNTVAESNTPSRFSIEGMIPAFGKGLLRPIRPVLDRLLGLDGLNRLYADGLFGLGAEDFIDGLLHRLGVELDLDEAALTQIPKTGPVMVIANHPLGALDGMILSRLIGRVRPDAKLMANAFLSALPELRDQLILVDSFQRGAANGQGLRRSVEWMKAGHCLGLFPAGAVSRFDFRERCITDAPWSPDAFRLAKLSGAKIVPMWISARNSKLFYILGSLHPMLRSIMLPREMARKGQKVRVNIGAPIEASVVHSFDSPEAGTSYLRQRCSALAANRDLKAQGMISSPG
jgi:putative hemolysin